MHNKKTFLFSHIYFNFIKITADSLYIRKNILYLKTEEFFFLLHQIIR